MSSVVSSTFEVKNNENVHKNRQGIKDIGFVVSEQPNDNGCYVFELQNPSRSDISRFFELVEEIRQPNESEDSEDFVFVNTTNNLSTNSNTTNLNEGKTNSGVKDHLLLDCQLRRIKGEDSRNECRTTNDTPINQSRNQCLLHQDSNQVNTQDLDNGSSQTNETWHMPKGDMLRNPKTQRDNDFGQAAEFKCYKGHCEGDWRPDDPQKGKGKEIGSALGSTTIDDEIHDGDYAWTDCKDTGKTPSQNAEKMNHNKGTVNEDGDDNDKTKSVSHSNEEANWEENKHKRDEQLEVSGMSERDVRGDNDDPNLRNIGSPSENNENESQLGRIRGTKNEAMKASGASARKKASPCIEEENKHKRDEQLEVRGMSECDVRGDNDDPNRRSIRRSSEDHDSNSQEEGNELPNTTYTFSKLDYFTIKDYFCRHDKGVYDCFKKVEIKNSTYIFETDDNEIVKKVNDVKKRVKNGDLKNPKENLYHDTETSKNDSVWQENTGDSAVMKDNPEASGQNLDEQRSISTGRRHIFQCRESKLTVKVLKSNITQLKVDVIVNAANRHLKHGGGVARAIADAAGKTLKKECETHISKNTEVKVSHLFSSTGGNLQKIKRVYHAVGPRWRNYPNKIDDCKRDLRWTVLRCLLQADSDKHRSIAFPSISAAIFSVPIDICVESYMKAVLHFTELRKTSSLEEVFFVDIDSNMVKAIRDHFNDFWEYRLNDEDLEQDKRMMEDHFPTLRSCHSQRHSVPSSTQRQWSGGRVQSDHDKSQSKPRPNSFSSSTSHSESRAHRDPSSLATQNDDNSVTSGARPSSPCRSRQRTTNMHDKEPGKTPLHKDDDNSVRSGARPASPYRSHQRTTNMHDKEPGMTPLHKDNSHKNYGQSSSGSRRPGSATRTSHNQETGNTSPTHGKQSNDGREHQRNPVPKMHPSLGPHVDTGRAQSRSHESVRADSPKQSYAGAVSTMSVQVQVQYCVICYTRLDKCLTCCSQNICKYCARHHQCWKNSKMIISYNVHCTLYIIEYCFNEHDPVNQTCWTAYLDAHDGITLELYMVAFLRRLTFKKPSRASLTDPWNIFHATHAALLDSIRYNAHRDLQANGVTHQSITDTESGKVKQCLSYLSYYPKATLNSF